MQPAPPLPPNCNHHPIAAAPRKRLPRFASGLQACLARGAGGAQGMQEKGSPGQPPTDCRGAGAEVQPADPRAPLHLRKEEEEEGGGFLPRGRGGVCSRLPPRRPWSVPGTRDRQRAPASPWRRGIKGEGEGWRLIGRSGGWVGTSLPYKPPVLERARRGGGGEGGRGRAGLKRQAFSFASLRLLSFPGREGSCRIVPAPAFALV